MIRAAAVLLLLATLPACSTKPQAFVEAETAVRERMKDPDATQFRNERFCGAEGKSIVGGEYNGKNSYGGYTGFKSFYFDGEKLGLEGDDEDWLPLISQCTAQIKDRTKAIERR